MVCRVLRPVLVLGLVLGLGPGCGRLGFAEQTADADAASDGDAPPTGFTHVVANGQQTCALYRERPYCWGRNDGGALGDGSNEDRHTPAPLAVPPGSVTALEVGDRHGCAVVGDTAHCWGGPHYAAMPAAVALPGTPRQIGTGGDFSCALVDAKVRCWGINSDGQLGDGSTTNRLTPATTASADDYVAISIGDDHGCGLTVTNEARCWGHNDDGVLGHGSTDPPIASVPVSVLGSVTSLPLIAGWHACALGTDGTVQCWGRNADGELGDGTTFPRVTPGLVPNLAGVTALAVGGGGSNNYDATCAVSNDELWCWGRGIRGRLGTGDEASKTVPTRVLGLPAGVAVKAAAVGYHHACALLEGGELWCWGEGDRGQLGDGRAVQSFAPVRVTPPS